MVWYGTGVGHFHVFNVFLVSVLGLLHDTCSSTSPFVCFYVFD